MTSIRNIAKTEFGSFNGLHWGQGIKIKTDTKPIVQQNVLTTGGEMVLRDALWKGGATHGTWQIF